MFTANAAIKFASRRYKYLVFASNILLDIVTRNDVSSY